MVQCSITRTDVNEFEKLLDQADRAASGVDLRSSVNRITLHPDHQRLKKTKNIPDPDPARHPAPPARSRRRSCTRPRHRGHPPQRKSPRAPIRLFAVDSVKFSSPMSPTVAAFRRGANRRCGREGAWSYVAEASSSTLGQGWLGCDWCGVDSTGAIARAGVMRSA